MRIADFIPADLAAILTVEGTRNPRRVGSRNYRSALSPDNWKSPRPAQLLKQWRNYEEWVRGYHAI